MDSGAAIAIVLGALVTLVLGYIALPRVKAARSAATTTAISLQAEQTLSLAKQEMDLRETAWKRQLSDVEQRCAADLTKRDERIHHLEGRLEAMTGDWAAALAKAVVVAIEAKSPPVKRTRKAP